MRHSTHEELGAYERMLRKMGMPLMLEQEYMQRTNRLMRHMGQLREQNEQLRELVKDLYFDLLGEMPESMLEDRRSQMRELGIEVEYQK